VLYPHQQNGFITAASRIRKRIRQLFSRRERIDIYSPPARSSARCHDQRENRIIATECTFFPGKNLRPALRTMMLRPTTISLAIFLRPAVCYAVAGRS